MESLTHNCREHNLPYAYLALSSNKINQSLICSKCLKQNDYLSIQSLSDLKIRYQSALKRYSSSSSNQQLDVLNKLITSYVHTLIKTLMQKKKFVQIKQQQIEEDLINLNFMKNFESTMNHYEIIIKDNEQQKRQIQQKIHNILPYIKHSQYWLKQAINTLQNECVNKNIEPRINHPRKQVSSQAKTNEIILFLQQQDQQFTFKIEQLSQKNFNLERQNKQLKQKLEQVQNQNLKLDSQLSKRIKFYIDSQTDNQQYKKQIIRLMKQQNKTKETYKFIEQKQSLCQKLKGENQLLTIKAKESQNSKDQAIKDKNIALSKIVQIEQLLSSQSKTNSSFKKKLQNKQMILKTQTLKVQQLSSELLKTKQQFNDQLKAKHLTLSRMQSTSEQAKKQLQRKNKCLQMFSKQIQDITIKYSNALRKIKQLQKQKQQSTLENNKIIQTMENNIIVLNTQCQRLQQLIDDLERTKLIKTQQQKVINVLQQKQQIKIEKQKQQHQNQQINNQNIRKQSQHSVSKGSQNIIKQKASIEQSISKQVLITSHKQQKQQTSQHQNLFIIPSVNLSQSMDLVCPQPNPELNKNIIKLQNQSNTSPNPLSSPKRKKMIKQIKVQKQQELKIEQSQKVETQQISKHLEQVKQQIIVLPQQNKKETKVQVVEQTKQQLCEQFKQDQKQQVKQQQFMNQTNQNCQQVIQETIQINKQQQQIQKTLLEDSKQDLHKEQQKQQTQNKSNQQRSLLISSQFIQFPKPKFNIEQQIQNQKDKKQDNQKQNIIVEQKKQEQQKTIQIVQSQIKKKQQDEDQKNNQQQKQLLKNEEQSLKQQQQEQFSTPQQQLVQQQSNLDQTKFFKKQQQPLIMPESESEQKQQQDKSQLQKSKIITDNNTLDQLTNFLKNKNFQFDETNNLFRFNGKSESISNLEQILAVTQNILILFNFSDSEEIFSIVSQESLFEDKQKSNSYLHRLKSNKGAKIISSKSNIEKMKLNIQFNFGGKSKANIQFYEVENKIQMKMINSSNSKIALNFEIYQLENKKHQID